jgi:hypothetical protein
VVESNAERGPAEDEATETDELEATADATDGDGAAERPHGGWMPRKRASIRTTSRELRRQRSQARKARRRLFLGVGGGAIALMLIAGLVLPSVGNFGTGDNNAGNNGAGVPPAMPLGGTELPVQDGGIIEVDAEHAAYTSMPPTSGPRYEEPAEWGVSLEQLPDESVVRNLEQGGVAINYNLSGAADIALLHDFASSLPGFPGCYVIQPYEGVPAESIAITSWGWTQTLTGVDRSSMEQFIASHRNQAPLFLDSTCGAGG